MANKEIYEREQSSTIVKTTMTQHTSVIADNFVADLKPQLKSGEHMPDVALVLTLMARAIAERGLAVARAGDAHEQEQKDDTEPRSRRDEADRQLRVRTSSLRANIESTYGRPALELFRLGSPCQFGASALISYTRNLITALKDPTLKLPAPLVGGFEFKAAAVVADLTPHYEALIRAAADVEREKSELATTLIAKDKAIAEHDRVFTKYVGIVELMARAAGLEEVSQRLRPSSRVPGVLEDHVDAAPTEPATPKAPIPDGMPGSDPFMK